MLRRRRPKKNEAIHFSFDSFLDLVTNVVGIIIRLILATWVGARSYHASMQWLDPDSADSGEKVEQAKPFVPPKITDDPLYPKVEIAKLEMEEAKARLLARLKELDTAEKKADATHSQLIDLAMQRASLDAEHKSLQPARTASGANIQLVSMSMAEIRRRSRMLLADIKTLEAQPVNRKQLKYHAPLSRAVQSDELFFECKNGRVTFIDLSAFMIEIEQSREENGKALQMQTKLERTTSAVGPYRLRYVVEREGSRWGLTGWTVEPLSADRGEPLQTALAPNSLFRQIADPLDGRISVVTFWVYPDSFEIFRHLRDYLYERGLDVAGRPLTPDASIAASRSGTASRGQ